MSWFELRQRIEASYNDEELRTLCFDLGIDYDVLEGRGKTGKVRDLITFMKRHERLSDLMYHLARSRPNATWPELPQSPSEGNVSSLPEYPYETPVRVAVWNALYDTIWSKPTFLYPPKKTRPLIDKFSIDLWKYIKRPINSRPDDPSQILDIIYSQFFSYEELKWRNFLLHILNYWNRIKHYSQKNINQAVNSALEKERAGFQYQPNYVLNSFVDGAWVEVSIPEAEANNSQIFFDAKSFDVVVGRITARAEQRFPDNLRTRKYQIDKEIEAWQSLKDYHAENVPESILAIIFRQAAQKHYDSFSAQKYMIDKEVEAWNSIQTYQADDIPEEQLNAILANAEHTYPTNFATRKYFIDKEVKAWKDLHPK